MNAVLHDLHTALRQLRRAPGFATLAILMLATGLGATITAYSLFHSIVLQPLPYPEPERLVVLRALNTSKAIDQEGVSATDLRDFQDRTTSFAALGGYRPNFAAYNPTDGDPAQWVTSLVTGGLFDALRPTPQLGRLFSPDEFSFAAERTVIISDAAWERYFNRRPDILNTTVLLDDQPHTVIGIMPATFREPAFVDAWLPFPAESPEYFARDSRYWTAIGRLAPDANPAVAATEIESLSHDLAREYPDSNRDWSATTRSLLEQRVTAMRSGLLLLLGTVALVLLIVCANLANLLLARALAKLPELGIRLSLGATASRLARVVAAESLILALIGGLLGAGFAAIALPAVAQHIPPALLPRAHEVALQPAAIGVGLAAALLCAALCALLPAWRLARANVNLWLKEGSSRGSTNPATRRWQAVLVVGQITLTVAVLAAALLLMRSLVQLQSTPTGFSPENVVLVRLAPPPSRYETNEDLARYYEDLIDAAEAVPGVRSAAVNASTPLTGITLTYPSWREGTTTDATNALDAVYAPVSPDFFTTVQLPLQRGRLLNDFDNADGAPVAVVNEAYARRMFPGRDALGQRIMIVSFMGPIYREIVGIVADTRQNNLSDAPPPQVYVPHTQMPWFFSTLLVRIERPSVVPAVRSALRAADPTLPVEPQLLEDAIAQGTTLQRLQSYLLGGFAAFALSLSAFGLYASLRFTLAQTLPEIGIRLALGATPGGIRALILGRVGKLVGTGFALGLLVAFPVSHALRAQLYGIGPADPLSYVALLLTLSLTALLTALPLAHRAARTDPTTILHSA
ncbi:ADOP family duplicated permease [Actomonas aquatica]|uniref:ADOP family duplicated permease n=1 Tax=Actomonas aquatica TaxID=2866162 RepID=A0ABZ1CA02_9BACT|nr:ADOP family duplicated permease [Opitutus sp. WL0086]WRQ87150.1 ADOP family duplicated permease [Opitutus sp. WL0086]